MKRLIVGYIIILGLYFIVKAVGLQFYNSTQGIIVDYDVTRHTTSSRPFSGHTVYRQYPIAKYLPKNIPKIDDEKVIKYAIYLINWDSINKFNAERLILHHYNEAKKAFAIDGYYTTRPWGAHFFTPFNKGERIKVIYSPNNPADGIVYSFFTYWVTIPSVCILALVYAIYTIVIIASEMKKSGQ